MHKFIVLDVEGYSTCKPYDVGFRVVDSKGKCYEEHSVAVMPAIEENLYTMCKYKEIEGMKDANEMCHRNIHEILTDTAQKYSKCYSIGRFWDALIMLITKHRIKRIWAYNCSFDSSALRRLFGEEKYSILCEMVSFCDIIPAILHTHLLTKKYVNFCKKNDFLTEKGNVRTKAEIVYKYLFGKMDFEEEHTGLADARIETEILLLAMNKSKNPKHKPCQAWKILQDFCVQEEIDLPVFHTDDNGAEFERMISERVEEMEKDGVICS